MWGKNKQGMLDRDVIANRKCWTKCCPFCRQELVMETDLIESIMSKKLIKCYRCYRCNMKFPEDDRKPDDMHGLGLVVFIIKEILGNQGKQE